MWMVVVLTISLQAGQVCLACEHCHPGFCSTSDNMCSYCIKGYYLRNGRCTQQCPQNCKSCTSTCDTCKTGYYGDDCLSECSEGCMHGTCSKNGGSCTYGCLEGYYDNQCLRCSVGCVGQTCDVLDGRCTNGCIIGYYGDRCQPKCSVGCIDQKCAVTDRQCTYGCIVGYYGDFCEWKCSTGCLNQECDKTSGKCKHGCVEGYYDEWCRSNCSDECVNQACDQTTGQCKNDCVDGYYGNGCRSKCSERCLIQKCDVINGQCTTGCIDGYYGGRCELECSDECVNKACEQASGNCTKIACIDGLYRSGTYCSRCPDSCAACTSISKCTSCKTGFFGRKCDRPCRNCKNNRCSIDGQCMDGCTDIHYQGTPGCDLCPSRCMACTSSTSCTSCSPGYFGSKCDQPCRNCKYNSCSFDGQCTHGCNDRHYQGHAGCDPCPNNCLTCTSSTSCPSCSLGYYGSKCDQPCRNCKYNSCSFDGQCTHGCNDRHYQGTTGCDPCPNNCLTCTSSTSCTSCSLGYYGSKCDQPCNCKNNRCSFDGQCTHGCNDRHYQGHAGCDPCPSNCLTCTSSTSCTSCSRGLYGNKCNQPCRNCKYNSCTFNGWCTHGCINRHYPGHASCDPCPTYCNTCKSSSHCDECRPGYHGTTCEKRCPSHCTTCENESNCLNCKTGYYGPSCEKNCSTTCFDSCSKEDGECECLDGYYKDGTYCKVCSRGCVKCHSKDVCSECASDDICSTCDDDYTNINGTCTSCHNCMDVSTCSSHHVCSQCLDGFWGQFCGNKCNDTCIRCDKSTGQCTDCKDNTFGLYCEQRCSSHCLLSPDTNVTCWKHNGTCTGGCIQGFTGLNCTEDADTEEKPDGSEVHQPAVIPVLCLLIVVLLAIVVGCTAVHWRKRRTGSDPRHQGALYITALSDSNPSNTYAHVYSDGNLTQTRTQGALSITAQPDANPNNTNAQVYSDGDLPEMRTKGALYIRAQSDATPINTYAEVYPVRDQKYTPTGPSPAGKTRTPLLIRDMSSPESDREPSRLYVSIDEANTDTGVPCGQDQFKRSPYTGVGSSSEEGDQFPRTLSPNHPVSMQGPGTTSPVATFDNQYESLRKNGESTNVYSPLNQTDVPANSPGPSDSHTESGIGASSEVDPVYWLPAGEYESLRTRHKTSDTYTSLQAPAMKIK